MKRRLILGLAVLVLTLGTTALAMPYHSRGWDRDHDRDDYRKAEYRHHNYKHHHHENYRRPAGWDHGQKRGWGDRDMPPGLAKKQHDRDWDRDRDHHTYPVHSTVNRPVHRPYPVATTTTTTTTTTHKGTYADWIKAHQDKKVSGQR